MLCRATGCESALPQSRGGEFCLLTGCGHTGSVPSLCTAVLLIISSLLFTIKPNVYFLSIERYFSFESEIKERLQRGQDPSGPGLRPVVQNFLFVGLSEPISRPVN